VPHEESGARRTFDLHPRNPKRTGVTIGLLAQSGGTLVGAIVDGAVRTWLLDPGGQLQLLILPSGFSARFDPFELLDERGKVVARGGEFVTVGGAHLVKAEDSRRLGHENAFSAWVLSRGEPTNPRRRVARCCKGAR
jgi:hypothetical protein